MWRFVFLASLLVYVHSLDNGLALTPPMGWRSWNHYPADIDQITINGQVEAIAERRHGKPSLLEVGYSHVGLDDAWQDCGAGVNRSFHDAKGFPIINTTRFPNMKAMNDKAHSLGVKTGWYSNNCLCSEARTQPGGHRLQDSEVTALLGFDGIKVDGCGPALDMFEWTRLLNGTQRPLLIEDCLNKKYWTSDVRTPGPIADVIDRCPSNLYRISKDIAPQFLSAMFNVNYGVRLLAPYQNKTHPASRPGCWSYPDMLQVGNGMTLSESRTHFALWCVTSAPLILGYDMTNATIYDAMYPIVSNPQALAINQQWAGWPGSLVKNASEYFDGDTMHGAQGSTPEKISFALWQIWSKPQPQQRGLHQEAVLIINLSDEPQDITLVYTDVNTALGTKVTAIDVWTGQGMHVEQSSTIFRNLGPHESRFLLLSATSDALIV